MVETIHNNLNHFMFIVLLVSRIGDILSTYLVTPKLKLEANPIVRKFRWPYALATLLVSFLAYYDIGLSVMAAVVFLMVSASNASKILASKVLGEEDYYRFTMDIIRRSPKKLFYFCMWAPGVFYIILGFTLIVLTNGLAQFAGIGFIAYPLITGFHSTLFYRKKKKEFEAL
jgi:hypothetical protein